MQPYRSCPVQTGSCVAEWFEQQGMHFTISSMDSSTKKVLHTKIINDVEWRKARYRNREIKVINLKKLVECPTIETLMGSLYVSCPQASCFQYAAVNATAGYSLEDDVNVGHEEEVATTATLHYTI